MGKHLDDLHTLDDTPITPAAVAAPDDRDLRDQPWYQFVGEIDELLADDAYLWAVDTLTGIKETVERTRRVTEGQQRAVSNVTAGGQRRHLRRRYEGYRGWSR